MSAGVTVVVVPRERFSCSKASLARLYEVTDEPFDLVYVDGRSPRRLRDHLRAEATARGFTLLREERYLSPNEARNLAVAHVRTPYTVFVDNDVLVTPGWLGALVACAQETGAWAVGPLYFEGDPADEVIHMAGGDLELTGEHGGRGVRTTHRHQHVQLGDVPELQREACDYVEFHCVLVRTEALDTVGPLDERLLATREHLDFCLRVHAGGGTVWFEPDSRVTYVSPPPVPLRDLPYFWLRWSDDWSIASLEHFCATYGVDRSYLERVSIMRRRRQAAFAGWYRAARRLVGARGEAVLRRVLRRAEPPVNRLLVWALRAGAATRTS